IKKDLGNSFVIGGNVGRGEGVREVENGGGDGRKVGIGGGRVCISKIKSGFGRGGWEVCGLNVCNKAGRKGIIGDGGLRREGDIGKSIGFG
uniref:IMP dehydrogenase n=1 Tax=Staphylococcus epidermidis TaxID=1282 RepID=UPI001643118B